MSDATIRQAVGGMPCPVFENPAFNPPPPLNEAKVAIVTTAGLRHADDPSWQVQDPSFRVFASDDRDMQLGHLSPNFDRSGFVADINVVYPIDRLNELAEQGVIGSVAPRHLSFMGAQDKTMSAIRQDSGPAMAQLLKEDGVDIALLTPV